MARIGHFMHTASTLPYYPLDPRAEDVRIEDIAQALAYQCRFNGMVKGGRFYSVAEHCVLCSYLGPEEEALERLLHDAAEAYLGDIIRPIKHVPCLIKQNPEHAEYPMIAAARQFSEGYRVIEEANERAIAERFHLTYPWPHSVKSADEMLAGAELDLLFGKIQHGTLHDAQKVWREAALFCWAPVEAEHHFMTRFNELWPIREQRGKRSAA
jgi:hypothetical protein